MLPRIWNVTFALGCLVTANFVIAQEKPAEETKPAETKAEAPKADDSPKPKEAVIHLDNPCGVTVHPGTGHVFVVSRQGLFRYVPGKPGKIYLEVDGFPTDEYGKGPKYNIGPLGVALWGDDRAIVADGSRKDGEELVRVYKIEKDPPKAEPRKEDAAEFTLGPIAPGEKSPKGEGNYYGVVVLENAIYVTANGDDTKGWVARSEIKDGKPGPLEPWLATKEAVNVDAPVAITVNKEKQLVIGQMGEVNVPNDSLLSIYNPADGKLVKNYKTGLHDITGLAYSPKTGKLYATDFAWSKPEDGGLFEVTIDGDEVKTKKVLELDRPTSLAFDKEGALYLTVFAVKGKAAEEGKPTGATLKLAPGL